MMLHDLPKPIARSAGISPSRPSIRNGLLWAPLPMWLMEYTPQGRLRLPPKSGGLGTGLWHLPFPLNQIL
jgi:hypothetical protein